MTYLILIGILFETIVKFELLETVKFYIIA